jgi:hypothetical protein
MMMMMMMMMMGPEVICKIYFVPNYITFDILDLIDFGLRVSLT